VSVTLTDGQVVRGPSHDQLRQYFATASERHAIYQRRGSGEAPPWTDDPIFQKYRFTNPDRELDKVTVWLRTNWREPYTDHRNLVFSMALARLINWPPTLEEIGFPRRWDPNRTAYVIKQRLATGKKGFTSAYLLGAIPKGAIRADYLVHTVLTPLKEKLDMELASDGAEFPSTLEQAWEYFKSSRGIGDFLAYEIVTDLRHTKHLCKADDLMTWANPGPGALRGLTRLWGFEPKTRHSDGYSFPKKHAVQAMQLLLERSSEYLPSEMLSWEMRHVEQWACEFDKYLRIKEGQGVLERFVPKKPGEW